MDCQGSGARKRLDHGAGRPACRDGLREPVIRAQDVFGPHTVRAQLIDSRNVRELNGITRSKISILQERAVHQLLLCGRQAAPGKLGTFYYYFMSDKGLESVID